LQILPSNTNRTPNSRLISRALLPRTVAGKVVFDVEEWQEVVMPNSYLFLQRARWWRISSKHDSHDAEDFPTQSDPAVLRHGDDGRG
jgi:hypothetical protein